MITQTTLPDGTLTERLYKLVGEQQFHGAVALLMDLLHSRSNPADQKLCYSLLPILGYCLYMAEDFEAAGEVYNQLFEAFPAVGEYQLYATYCSIKSAICGKHPVVSVTLRQNLVAAGIYPPRRSTRVPNTPPQSICKAKASGDETRRTKGALTPVEAALFESAALYRSGSFEEGRRVAAAANVENGWSPSLAYNEALCAYKSGEREAAARIAGGIVSVCYGNQTEFVAGMAETQHMLAAHKSSPTTNFDGQSTTGKVLVAAANLCCAVDILQGRLRTANEHLLLLSSSTATTKAALGTDYVTLHNQALSLATTDPTESIRILASLLDERFAPKTTVANLLILYCKSVVPTSAVKAKLSNQHLLRYGHFEAAEKLAASFGEVNLGDLNECETEFLRNFMLIHSAPLEAQKRLAALEEQMREQLRVWRGHAEISATCCTTSVVERSASTALQEYIDTLIPVLVTLAESYIADGKLSKAEALLGSYGSMCGDSNYWKINMGHILFMQVLRKLLLTQKKYDKCLSFYEDGVRTDVCGRALQGWEVVALTNALAANILLGHIDQAQQLLNLLNASEQLDVRNASTASGWNDSIPHSSVAKLIVGTLYCAEKAYDYGVRSVLEALDPMERALNVNTWGHCKACIGSLLTDVALGNFILDYELKRNIAAVLLRIEAKARSLPCIGVGEYEMKCPQRPTKGLVGAVRTAVPMFIEIVAVEYHIESNAVERLIDDEIKTS